MNCFQTSSKQCGAAVLFCKTIGFRRTFRYCSANCFKIGLQSEFANNIAVSFRMDCVNSWSNSCAQTSQNMSSCALSMLNDSDCACDVGDTPTVNRGEVLSKGASLCLIGSNWEKVRDEDSLEVSMFHAQCNEVCEQFDHVWHNISHRP